MDKLGNVRALGTRCLEKFEAGGNAAEEFFDGDNGAARRAVGLIEKGLSVLGLENSAVLLPRVARNHGDAGNGSDAGEGFAAKAERLDGKKVIGAGELAGAMAGERGGHVLVGDACAVVRDADEALSAAAHFEANVSRACIQSVFDEFFDHRGRAFDDFAGRDFGGEVIGEDANGHCAEFYHKEARRNLRAPRRRPIEIRGGIVYTPDNFLLKPSPSL